MPIVISQSGSSSGASTGWLAATTTVNSILTTTMRETHPPFFSSGGNQTLLIEFVDRVQQEISRFSRWDWQLSAVKRFITIAGQTDYWLGTSGSNPAGTVDTALNLTDIHQIKEGTVYDRTNHRELKRVLEVPALRKLNYDDAAARQGLPKLWRESSDTPNVMNLYPAPDYRTSSLYRPIPDSPYCSTSSGGALADRTYFVRITYVDAAGNESSPCINSTRIFVPASSYLKVWSPDTTISKSASGVSYSQWKVYVSTTENEETIQNGGSAINIDTHYTESGSGITTTGAAWPTENNLEPLYGYIIEFRYWKQRSILSDTSHILQIPDIYKDIVVAGVNFYILRFLTWSEPQWGVLRNDWERTYRQGIQNIIKDFNLFPKDGNFIAPDKAALPTYGWNSIWY